MDYICEPARQTSIRDRVDVVVSGGGLSGVMAAVSAARTGAKTLLCERYSSLGAVATMGLPLQGFYAEDNSQAVIGLAEEFRQRLHAINGATDPILCEMHNPYVVVDPESVKLVCQQMLLEAGVKVLLSAPVVDVFIEEGRISAAIIEGKSGREAIVAKQFVDCTGDADLVAQSGAAWHMADAKELQAMTMNVQLAGVDIRVIQNKLQDDPDNFSLFPLLSRQQLYTDDRYILVGLSEYVQKAIAENGDSALWESVCYITLVNEGTVCLNSVHIGELNPCETDGLTDIELQGRDQAWKAANFMKKYIPGFENSYIINIGPWAGIRESRIIDGLRTLTEKDIEDGVIPQDTIALGCYPIDFHVKGAVNGDDIEVATSMNGLKFEKVPLYGIPYGCMIPRNANNLLVAGRTISATRTAMSSSRVMAQCMAEGEAAGIAAALCADQGISPATLNVRTLQEILRKRGARLR